MYTSVTFLIVGYLTEVQELKTQLLVWTAQALEKEQLKSQFLLQGKGQ